LRLLAHRRAPGLGGPGGPLIRGLEHFPPRPPSPVGRPRVGLGAPPGLPPAALQPPRAPEELAPSHPPPPRSFGSAGRRPPQPVGRYLLALFLVWSPYHYSRQAYGLSVMYAYRSGGELEAAGKRLILWVCLLPFFWTLLHPDGGMGLILPRTFYAAFPFRQPVMQALTVLSLAAPAALWLWGRSRRAAARPLNSPVASVSAALWLPLLQYVHP